jgi:hypothetical protein
MGRTRLKAAYEEPTNNIKCQNQDKRFNKKKKQNCTTLVVHSSWLASGQE